MYDTESAFSKALTAKLKHDGFIITRLESHSTGNGIPDMFVMGHDFDCFIELKNIKQAFSNGSVKIPWRPGQQAWALEYAHSHIDKCTLTMVAMDDHVLVIRMDKHYQDNRVHLEDQDEHFWYYTKDSFSKLSLRYWLPFWCNSNS